MKITHNKVGQNLSLRDNAPPAAAASAGKSGDVKNVKNDLAAKSDVVAKANDPKAVNDAGRVTLSTRAQQMKQANDIAKATPDVDEANVLRLQKLIDSGEYKVDAEAVASKMVDEHANWAD